MKLSLSELRKNVHLVEEYIRDDLILFVSKHDDVLIVNDNCVIDSIAIEGKNISVCYEDEGTEEYNEGDELIIEFKKI